MTTLALTVPTTAPLDRQLQGVDIIRRGLKLALLLIGAVLTFWILRELGPVVYGLPMPLIRRGLSTGAAAN